MSNLKTVLAFGGEQKELKRFQKYMIPAEAAGRLKGIYTGLGGGLMWFFMYTCYAFGFLYGIDLMLKSREAGNNEYTPTFIIVVLFGVLCGSQNLGLTAPHSESFATAKGAARSIFEIIDRFSNIDSLGSDGLKPPRLEGHINFENIIFQYPSRTDTTVLKGLNLSIKAGQTVALVGLSGCGKSTCIQLLQRLYDPYKVNSLNIGKKLIKKKHKFSNN